MKLAINDCSTYMNGLLARTDKRMRLSFLSGVVLGLAVHMFMFANKLPNHDDIICLFYNDATVTSGRFFLAALIALSSNFSLPWVNGVISVLALGATSAVLVKLFDIKKTVSVLLCSFSLVAFPSVANAFGFMFTADGYMLGFFLAALAAYLVDTKKHGYLPATVLLVLATGTYQATLCFFVSVLAVRGVVILLRKELDDKQVLCRLAAYAGTAAVSAVLYIFAAKLALHVTGLEMENYAGLEGLGTFSLSTIPRMIADAYIGFFTFAFRTSGVHLGLWLPIVHLVIGALIVSLIVLIAVRSGLRSKMQLVLICIVTLLLPLLLNSAPFLGTPRVHVIMMFGVAMIYWLVILLCEIASDMGVKGNPTALMGWGAAVMVFLASCGWGVYANQCYLKLQLKYENSAALCNRIVNRIEQDPAYAPGMPVAFIGEPEDGNYPQAKEGHLGSLGSDEGFGGPSEYSFIYDDRHFKDFIRWYIGVGYELLASDAEKALLGDARVTAMPCYPEKGSIADIDGTLVVKVGPNNG